MSGFSRTTNWDPVMLSAGTCIELRPEKAVAGGRMLARADEGVVLVLGAIPGERIVARLDRRQQGVWFATTVDVLEASPDRIDPGPDPACGGMAMAHVAYPKQCELKASMLVDAMARIGRVALDAPVAFTGSPTRGYRMRYRVHTDGRLLGFFREGTHDVCDPASSGQLAEASLECLGALAQAVRHPQSAQVEGLQVLENLRNTERAVNLSMRAEHRPSAGLLAAIAAVPGVGGLSWTRQGRGRVVAAAGQAWVSDPVDAFTAQPTPQDRAPRAERPAPERMIRRHASAFFQANRFLTPVLARRVVAAVTDGPAVDLYAGVGLFAICLVATGRREVVAIEHDPVSVRDLLDNAAPFGPDLRVEQASVESFLERGPLSAATLIVDPPRTGMSRIAMQGILASNARRIVYVSCDIATLARDTRRLLDRGYVLSSLEALDLFPNTPHVEGLAIFDR